LDTQAKHGVLVANYDVMQLSKLGGNREKITNTKSHPVLLSCRILICRAGKERNFVIFFLCSTFPGYMPFCKACKPDGVQRDSLHVIGVVLIADKGFSVNKSPFTLLCKLYL